jgi:sugar lactone lactonase YvrE
VSEPEVVLDLGMELGEGVFWDAARGSLVWVDILGGEVHELHAGRHRRYAAGSHVGAAAPRAGGGWVLAVREGFAALDPAAGQVTELRRVAVAGTRMNDGNVDAAGRFFAGTMLDSEEAGGGRLYRLDSDHSVTAVLDPVGVSNGIDWSPDGRTVYYVDSLTSQVAAFDFDLETGAWSNRRVLAHIEAGFPDGLTVDTEGGIWVAIWEGASVRRYTPDGKLDRSIEVPAPRVTACGFGGEDLSTLYITTARVGLKPEHLATHPLSGSLFATRPGFTGRPRHAYRG